MAINRPTASSSRLGFELQRLSGKHRTLAHVRIYSRRRVGRYGMDIVGFEQFLETLNLMDSAAELVVIDEIGKMELFSSRFRRLVLDVMSSDKGVLATIPMKGSQFIREIKQRPDIHLFEVTHGNRDRLPEAIIEGSQ